MTALLIQRVELILEQLGSYLPALIIITSIHRIPTSHTSPGFDSMSCSHSGDGQTSPTLHCLYDDDNLFIMIMMGKNRTIDGSGYDDRVNNN